MVLQKYISVVIIVVGIIGATLYSSEGRRRPHRILLDTDVDTDDFFALLYLLKLNRSEFDLQVCILITRSVIYHDYHDHLFIPLLYALSMRLILMFKECSP